VKIGAHSVSKLRKIAPLRVVMAVPAPAHALLEPIAPQPLAEVSASVLAALIAVE